MALACLDAKKNVGEAAAKKSPTLALIAKIALSALRKEEYNPAVMHWLKGKSA